MNKIFFKVPKIFVFVNKIETCEHVLNLWAIFLKKAFLETRYFCFVIFFMEKANTFSVSEMKRTNFEILSFGICEHNLET